MDNVLEWITDNGFAIVAYLLIYFRMEKKIDKLIEAVKAIK